VNRQRGKAVRYNRSTKTWHIIITRRRTRDEGKKKDSGTK
jgi:hypothetical protein